MVNTQTTAYTATTDLCVACGQQTDFSSHFPTLTSVWPVHPIHRPTTGAFLSPFQDAPLDLDFPPGVFYQRRQESLEARLRGLASMAGAELAGK